MDKASNQHISTNWNQLNDTDRSVLDMIRRYSIKHGAAHLKHETMEKALSKSNSTIRRSLRKLESLSIIKRIKFIRKIMNGIGANIYAILPFNVNNEQGGMNREEVAENSTVSKPEVAKTENEPLLYKSSSNLVPNTYSNSPHDNPQSFYSVFKQSVVSRLGEDSQSLISKLYGVYRSLSLKQLKYSIHKDKKELFESLSLQAITITLMATKKKPIKSITGFYSGVYSRLISKYVHELEDDYRVAQCTTEHIEWFMPAHLRHHL